MMNFMMLYLVLFKFNAATCSYHQRIIILMLTEFVFAN